MSDHPLHLPNLSINSFRGIRDLTINKLGRATLFVGQNSVGKTTILDAVRVFAERGKFLDRMLFDQDEYALFEDEDGDFVSELDWNALFHGRSMAESRCVSIGPISPEDLLTVEITVMDRRAREANANRHSKAHQTEQALRISYRGKEQVMPLGVGFRRSALRKGRMASLEEKDDVLPEISCELMGPGLWDNNTLAHLWDGIALTDDQELVFEALSLIFTEGVEGVTVVERGYLRSRTSYQIRRISGPRISVRLKNARYPVPLKSLGDAASRLFGVALALASCRGGILLVDEAENGIHYELQKDFWRLVLQSAHNNDVQVLATTHSWDCVAGFAAAAEDYNEIEGCLVRLDRDGDGVKASEYTEDTLAAAVQHRFEVR